jgi:hypothetical protein
MYVDFPGIARDLLNARPNASRMLLIIALTVGVPVRFYRLSALPMTADEGAPGPRRLSRSIVFWFCNR